eukprot:TRINITY_DN102342_c0_g1_i1.p1 TRINITY_DN102342_c0_g1~~TRINITY_DN102342_c0_g1_i1.p1  ORF type:complete len:308 (-),score=43.18 TRINITY_DN102342_c0_g1_i1:88-1011(-)
MGFRHVVAVAICIAACGGTMLRQAVAGNESLAGPFQSLISQAVDAREQAARKIRALVGENAQLYPLGSADFSGRLLLVLARFNEDVSWAQRLASKDIKVLVVNRGKPLKFLGPHMKEVADSVNKGKEATAYFRVIDALKRAPPNDMPLYLAFLQAKPSEHFSSMEMVWDTLSRLDAHAQGKELSGKAENPRWPEIAKDLAADGFAYLAPRVYQSMFGQYGPFFKKMAPVFSRMMLIRNRQCYLTDQGFGPGGNFVVTASVVTRQSKDWFAAWDQLLENEKNPLEGHMVERSWACIWTPGYGKCKCRA